MERIKEGEVPYCAASCPMDAFIFGDLNDPDSDVSRLMREGNAKPLKKKYGTKPKVFYANLNELEDMAG